MYEFFFLTSFLLSLEFMGFLNVSEIDEKEAKLIYKG